MKRLGQIVKENRLDQRLSVRAAAHEAGIDRSTWSTLEDGSRRLSEHLWPAVERVLDWSPGSVRAILGGGDPTPIVGALVTGETGENGDGPCGGPYDLADEVDRISRLHHLSVEQRMRMIRALVEMHEREEAAQA